jgi:hypothetical protein
MLTAKLKKPPTHIFYTLHFKQSNIPYLVHLKNPEDQYKSTLVSLMHRQDSLKIGNLLEHHKKENNNYPDNCFDYKTMFRLKIKSSKPIEYKNDLEDIQIRSWKQEELVNYCVEHWLDLMLIESLEDNGTIQVVEFELSKDYLISRLNKSLE